jgi:hypothetical protein
MKPLEFKGVNLVLAKDQPQYIPLPVCYEGGTEAKMTSCWKLSFLERIKLLFKGKLIYYPVDLPGTFSTYKANT